MAEAIKVALIRDGSFFDWLEDHAEALAKFEPSAVERLIERTAELHLAHIASSGDPFESKSARPLDYGHWIAHKLESMTDHALRHGEAVAIGMAVDTLYSAAKGLLDAASAERVVRLLRALSLPIYHPALHWLDETGRPRFLSGLEEFRQHLGGRLSVTLLTDVGGELQADKIDELVLFQQVERLAAWS
jgi:3-dehydroquinate synthase